VSGIDTVARVARLRERAARARYAQAAAKARSADELVQRRAAELAEISVPADATADGTSFAGWRATTAGRAEAVTDARTSAREAAAGRGAALEDWQDLSRRREALDDVLLRWRAARRAEADAAAQRQMDDLAGQRRGRR
jgi:flagellar export protein FliJ